MKMKQKLFFSLFLLLAGLGTTSCSKDETPVSDNDFIEPKFEYRVKSIVNTDTNEEVMYCEYDSKGRLTYYKDMMPYNSTGYCTRTFNNFKYTNSSITCDGEGKDTDKTTNNVKTETGSLEALLDYNQKVYRINEESNKSFDALLLDYQQDYISKMTIVTSDIPSTLSYIWENDVLMNATEWGGNYQVFYDQKCSYSSIINKSNFDVFDFPLYQFGSGQISPFKRSGYAGSYSKYLLNYSESTWGEYTGVFYIQTTNNSKGYVESFSITKEETYDNELCGTYKITYY